MRSLWKDPAAELATVFPASCIEMLGAVMSKPKVIRLLVDSLAREMSLDGDHTEGMIGELLRLERQMSSAIRGGVALPYLEVCDAPRLVGAIGLAPGGVEFDSSDGQPTRLVFLMLVPPSRVDDAARLRTWLANFGRSQIASPSPENLIRPDQFILNLIQADPAA